MTSSRRSIFARVSSSSDKFLGLPNVHEQAEQAAFETIYSHHSSDKEIPSDRIVELKDSFIRKKKDLKLPDIMVRVNYSVDDDPLADDQQPTISPRPTYGSGSNSPKQKNKSSPKQNRREVPISKIVLQQEEPPINVVD